MGYVDCFITYAVNGEWVGFFWLVQDRQDEINCRFLRVPFKFENLNQFDKKCGPHLLLGQEQG